mmetsp:Transcript_29039/g.27937  ORF Transcript_29039/g.27937 Transcript_29039/m.27937 type:complete len:80 (-) Transcript_29039:3-242(-)
MNRTKEIHTKAVTIDDHKVWTNVKAMMENTGSRGGTYIRFVDFNTPELILHLALYLLHSFYPSPQVEIKFKSEEEDPVN